MREFVWGAKFSRRGGSSCVRSRVVRARRALRRARRSLRRARGLPVAKRARRGPLRCPSGSRRGASASALGLLVVALAACAGAAWGCGWGGFENSVRFGYGADERARSRLPPLPLDVRGTKKGGGAAEEEEGVSAKQRAADVDKLWGDADDAVEAGDLEKARKFLREYVGRTADFVNNDYWEEPTNWRERRNSAFDRLDALEALDHGSTSRGVLSYLAARRAYDEWLDGTAVKPGDRVSWPPEKKREAQEKIEQKEAERAAGMADWGSKVEEELSGLASDPNLADNAAYLRAVGDYRAGQTGDPVEAFESVASRYPRSEKREAALYMAGRAAMDGSGAYLGEATATSEDPCRGPDCRDDAWKRARKDFTRLLAAYPRGRYAPDARGWLAYLDYRVGDTAGALVEYYRLLGGDDVAGRELAARSLRLVRARADDADMDAVEHALEGEPRAALAYAYHNIYNYASGYYLRVPEVADENPYESSKDYSEKYEWQEHKEATLRSRAELKELRRAADFAARLMRRYPRAEVGGAFAVRLAGAQFELSDARRALDTARRALSSGLDADERGQGLWIEGAAEYRLKDYAAARKTLSRLAEEFPAGDLARGAREMVATVAEDEGDLAGALEQYLALGYDPDVAYFVDVLMTPEQLASFVSKHQDSPRLDELLYALGLRYLRAGRYAEARATFSRVRTSDDSYDLSSADYSSYYSRRGSYGNADGDDGPRHPKLNFRHTFWNSDDDGDTEYLTKSDAGGQSLARDTRVYADWLLRDMKTTDDLERLQKEVDRPAGDEAKAEAMYQLASYFYEGELLFYNPAAWRGMRAEMLYSLNETNYRAPDEAQIVWRYEQEHEGPARALNLYLEIVRRYPDTRAARDALYTAIFCQQRLANFNGYWRGMYDKGLHAGDRLVTLADLRRAYPNYRLPVVGHWEPSTRTVGGEPAWPAPPKARALTRTERARLEIRLAERRAARGWELFGEIYGGRVRHWALAALRWAAVALVACAVLLVFRRTRRARHFLYRQLARCCAPGRAKTLEDYAPRSSYGAHLGHTRGGGLRAAACEAAHRFMQLALHERGRAALALNVFTHGLLTVLLWAVLWALKK